MKPPRSFGLTPTLENIQRQVEQAFKVMSNISFGSTTANPQSNKDGSDQNIVGFKATGTTPGVADTDFIISHNLGRIPIGFLVASVDAAAIIYKSPTAWTSTTITLRCNVINVNYFIIII